MKVYRPVAASFPISSPYGSRIDPVTGEVDVFHYGVDFAVPMGTPVVAAVTGRIVKVGYQNPDDKREGFGFRIWQQSDSHMIYVCYAHLSEQIVKEGDEVVAGTRIGRSGNSGKSSGPHLHFEVRAGGITGHKGEPIEFIS